MNRVRRAGDITRTAGSFLLCFALVAWSLVPSYTHVPVVFETIQDHIEMVEEHGHSHGFLEDLHWAMHGHSHDVVDHDHSPAFLLASFRTAPLTAYSEAWRGMTSTDGPSRHFRIERPPRA